MDGDLLESTNATLIAFQHFTKSVVIPSDFRVESLSADKGGH